MDNQTWELLITKINTIGKDVKELLEFKWKVMGGAFVMGSVGSLVMHLLLKVF